MSNWISSKKTNSKANQRSKILPQSFYMWIVENLQRYAMCLNALWKMQLRAAGEQHMLCCPIGGLQAYKEARLWPCRWSEVLPS